MGITLRNRASGKWHFILTPSTIVCTVLSQAAFCHKPFSLAMWSTISQAEKSQTTTFLNNPKFQGCEQKQLCSRMTCGPSTHKLCNVLLDENQSCTFKSTIFSSFSDYPVLRANHSGGFISRMNLPLCAFGCSFSFCIFFLLASEQG